MFKSCVSEHISVCLLPLCVGEGTGTQVIAHMVAVVIATVSSYSTVQTTQLSLAPSPFSPFLWFILAPSFLVDYFHISLPISVLHKPYLHSAFSLFLL